MSTLVIVLSYSKNYLTDYRAGIWGPRICTSYISYLLVFRFLGFCRPLSESSLVLGKRFSGSSGALLKCGTFVDQMTNVNSNT